MVVDEHLLEQLNAGIAKVRINEAPVRVEAMSDRTEQTSAGEHAHILRNAGVDELPLDYYWVRVVDQSAALTASVRRRQPDMPPEYNNVVAYHRDNGKWGIRYCFADTDHSEIVIRIEEVGPPYTWRKVDYSKPWTCDLCGKVFWQYEDEKNPSNTCPLRHNADGSRVMIDGRVQI